MRRLYVLPKSVWEENIQIGTHSQPDAPSQPVLVPMRQLFHPAIGSHYLDLPGGMILLMTSFDHDERSEDLFHAHPDVAVLPHPGTDGNKPLRSHLNVAGYKFTQHHLGALQSHPSLQIQDTDTVLDVARKASALHPEVRFRNVL